ncbi:MAG: hypothetical protein JWM28_3988 [Chitinophagaceae bacterium]|nr:hypothetical protein [Chitinophagaceae bacterium]
MSEVPDYIKVLTVREIEIIKLLYEGLTSKEIATKFRRSFKMKQLKQ